jgi:hypothetical protein
MTEKIKNYLGWALVLGVLAVGVAALWYANSYSRMSDINFSRTFAVSGQGKVVVVPDIARFTFSVVSEGGKDLTSLQQDNVKKANAAIDFLKQQGVDSKDIATQAYNIEPRYETCFRGPCPPPTIVGYTIRQTVSVKARDLEKVGDLLGGVVSRGANSTFGPDFTVDDPTKLESDARALAIAEAREKARSVASAGKFSLGRLVSIEEGNNFPMAYGKGGGGMMDAAVSSQAPVVPAFEAGSQDITVNVTLRYEID